MVLRGDGVTAKWQFWVVAVLAGTGLGAIQAASRALMASLIPRDREAEFFDRVTA